MAISCIYCGGSHQRADEVRACWARTSAEERAELTERAEREAAADRVVATAPVATSTPVFAAALVGDAARWAGPDALGRHLVLLDEVDVPLPWRACEVVVVDHEVLAAPASTVTRLRSAHHQRQRMVIVMRAAFQRPPAQTDARPLHEVGARGELLLDELHHLVWSNSVVLGAEGARWAWAERAMALGASPAATADVEVAGVGPCWVDGGPLRLSGPLDGAVVVPAVAVEHGAVRPFGLAPCTAALAPDQLAAVTHPGGAARIIAPAGSGKTRVLTERARHLITVWGIPSSAITMVAYNRRAQEEMQQRLADLPAVQVRTLNALALAIINGVAPFAPQPRRWQTLDEMGVRRLLGDLVQAPRKRNVDPLAPWLEAMSAVRLGLLTHDDVEARYDGDVSGLEEVMQQVDASMQRSGSVDFDSQILSAITLLLTNPTARTAAQRACRVLLVDEFQDLTPAHILLIRLLSAPGFGTFGVGDDDQTIYGYNGADPGWLIDYASLFPGAGDHPLEVNYRCPGDVVVAVERMLRRNHRRVPKAIRAHHSTAEGMHRVVVDDALAATVDHVANVLAAGNSPASVAVLARVNSVLAPVQVALRGRGIATTTVAGPEFLTRSAVRSTLAWLRVATSGRSSLKGTDLKEALQRPSRSLHPRIAEWVGDQRSVRDLERLADRMNKDNEARAILAFAADVDKVQEVAATGTTLDVIDTLVDSMGLAGTLATFDLNRHGMNAPSQGDDLLAMRHLATLHPQPSGFAGWLVQQFDQPRTPSAAADDVVTLATVHRVKGQEWPHVVVHLADEHQFPHRLADDVTEERRLFHVALTRTSSQVQVVSSSGAVSPFLRELDVEPSADERVRSVVRSTVPATSGGGARRGGGTSGTAAAATADTVVLDALGEQLFELLRQFRNDVRNGKPAYTVFGDGTLQRIAASRPVTLDALARVKGVGPMKLEQYGDRLLAIVTAFVEAQG